MKKRILLFLFIVICGFSMGQKRTFDYSVSLTGFISTEKSLPFWAVSNKGGLLPNGRGGSGYAGIFSEFNEKQQIQFAYGFSGAGYLSKSNNKGFIDELYLSSRWKKLRLDLGMIRRDIEFNGISSTNGNIAYSNNSRPMPGYNLRSEFINIPFTSGIFAFKFNWGDYVMIDDRYVDDTRVHNKSLFLKISPFKRLEIIAGMEHIVQWAGDNPEFGKQPSSADDYVKIFFGKAGGEDATQSDSLNALGNHIASKLIKVNYLADNYTITLYNSIVMEDGHVEGFRNFPDGVYGIYYGNKDKKRWISDIIYEFTYTKYQSGPLHDRPATEEEMAKQDPSLPYYGTYILGGNDQYFNHGEYKSGWTYYGKAICSPLMTPKHPESNGITMGILNNRVLAHHIGIKGIAFQKIPYKTMLTYSLNYGTYDDRFEKSLKQFSFGLEARLPDSPRIPFHMDLGIYADTGEFLPDNFGMTLRIYKKGRLF